MPQARSTDITRALANARQALTATRTAVRQAAADHYNPPADATAATVAGGTDGKGTPKP